MTDKELVERLNAYSAQYQNHGGITAEAADSIEQLCAELDFEKIDNTKLKGELATVAAVPFPVSWTVKMKKKQKETQDILSYHTQAAGCSDKARAKASGGRQPIEECGRTGL